MIDFHYAPTGNSLKVAIMLEETGLKYRLVRYDIMAGTHLTPSFRLINPNNKLPAIVDNSPADDGSPIAIFESGAILLYLARLTEKYFPDGVRQRTVVEQWLIWQMAGLGPMHGQAHHFKRYAPEGQTYAEERYMREARRLLDVMQYRLEQLPYLAEEYGLADMASYPWVRRCHVIGIKLDDYPAVADWSLRLEARPAVQAAIGSIMEEAQSNTAAGGRAKLTPEQWENMFGDKMHAAAKAH